ncbi:MAG: quinolinate synthase NadA [Limnochordia bacterium]|jgi:quinolinate synthase|nr:quinolinate synthase NadA [Limnochordia bacterium]MDD2628886.1 quinolinate synthase NadA [Limnochordia bacterium]MDD4518860.1 quinolinate synthase NadA [Limnochordia bacterium]
MSSIVTIEERIVRLKKERNAIILAHNYQLPEIQDIADVTGDSLELARLASQNDADVIVFCGVDFMAETAAIVNPDKTVLLPAKDAGCPLAEMADAQSLVAKKKEYPDAAVVCYVNSSAEVKAESDICCTSANAVDVVNSLKEDRVLFVPDQNLASWVARHTEKEIIPWNGYCITHHRVRAEEVHRAKEAHPDAVVVVHPECPAEVVDLADEVASTTGILRYVKNSSAQKFIIGTEMGLLHRLMKENPGKVFFILSPGLVCPNMKKISSIQMVLDALESNAPQVRVDEEIRLKALAAVERMLAI